MTHSGYPRGRISTSDPVPSLTKACCNRVLLRGPSLGESMIRTTVLRALVLTAAFAAALTPVTCLGQESKQLPPKLPAKATKKLPPELLSLLQHKKMPAHSPIL